MPTGVDTSKIILGSGKLYIVALSSGAIPNNAVTDANWIGDIQGGATLEYKPTIKEVKNDFDDVRKNYITAENVTLKAGVLTWALSNLEKLSVGVTYNSVAGTITIGGTKTITEWGIIFVHDTTDVYLKVSIKGYNSNGFSLKFDPSKESILDATFTATRNTTGVLVTIDETRPTATEPTTEEPSGEDASGE